MFGYRSTAILDDSFTGEDEPNKIKGNRIHPSDTPSRFEAVLTNYFEYINILFFINYKLFNILIRPAEMKLRINLTI